MIGTGSGKKKSKNFAVKGVEGMECQLKGKGEVKKTFGKV